MDPVEVISANLADVRDRIAGACDRAGRDPAGVELVAVTKYAPLEHVRILLGLGVDVLGESRPQQLVERAAELGSESVAPRWHLVGHLQRNKVRRVLPVAEVVHSIDGTRLLDAIERIAVEEDRRPRVLLEVNVSGEASKDGFSVENLRAAWDEVSRVERTRIVGLMTMPPRADEATVRECFRSLRALRDELADRSQGEVPLPELSMGTSGDFPLAVEEGATKVRVGRTLFEGL